MLLLSSKLRIKASYYVLSVLLHFLTMSFAARNAVITGANRGLGLELCKQLAVGDAYSSIYALCRKTSDELTALSKEQTKIKIVENIEVTKDDVTHVVHSVFETLGPSPTPIHLLIHNAGALGPPENFDSEASLRSSQTLSNITTVRMRFAFELNTIAPLHLTQALATNLEIAGKGESGPGKVVIISSAMGSIAENGSGDFYAYRAAKAAVNMVGKSLSFDLKDKNIAVGLVHPGYVYTGFGGKDTERKSGQRDVDESARGVIEAIEKTTMDTTGTFYHGNYGEGVKTLPW